VQTSHGQGTETVGWPGGLRHETRADKKGELYVVP